jgi:hypothetical protein
LDENNKLLIEKLPKVFFQMGDIDPANIAIPDWQERFVCPEKFQNI